MSIKKSSYKSLVKYITEQYTSARQAMVQAYWNIGQRIVEVEQEGDARAQYGEDLLNKLSVELTTKLGTGFSVRNIKNMRQFYLAYPKRQVPAELTWTKYVELSRVKDEGKRELLTHQAVRKGYSEEKIKELVKKENRISRSGGPCVLPKQRTELRYIKQNLSVFTLDDAVCPKGYARVDCGFHIYRIVKKQELKSVNIGKMSYTYPARINAIVDGDTIRADIELAFDTEVMQILRLRQIDAPEVKTPEGRKSKKFLSDLLKDVSRIVVRTYSPDIYGRHPADIFYLPGCDNADEIFKKGFYLSQVIIDNGHARVL